MRALGRGRWLVVGPPGQGPGLLSGLWPGLMMVFYVDDSDVFRRRGVAFGAFLCYLLVSSEGSDVPAMLDHGGERFLNR